MRPGEHANGLEAVKRGLVAQSQHLPHQLAIITSPNSELDDKFLIFTPLFPSKSNQVEEVHPPMHGDHGLLLGLPLGLGPEQPDIGGGGP